MNLKNTRKPTLFHKFLDYSATREQKLHTARFGWGGFRVLTVTAKRGVQGVRERGVARTRIESMQEAARLAAPEAPPGFFLFADMAASG